MFTMHFQGFCPACRLADKNIKMVLNTMDFFACPQCGLQVCLYGDLFVIVLHRRDLSGLKHESSVTIDKIKNPDDRALCALSRDEEGEYSSLLKPGEIISTEEKFREYLAHVE